jgi:hypothetical protein
MLAVIRNGDGSHAEERSKSMLSWCDACQFARQPSAGGVVSVVYMVTVVRSALLAA